MLVLVVGPSGAGKDTLLDGARAALPNARFVRRFITRPAEAGGEDHVPVSEVEFAQRAFALRWRAHGLCYGIPADIVGDLARGGVVIVNVSRAVVAEAASRFPAHVIEVTAPPELLAARLSARGRETAADVTSRLARSVALPDGVPVTRVMNDGSVDDGVARFVAAVTRLTAAARRS